jgi:hypothetical protein
MMTPGTWSCDPFSAVIAVFAVFDRLLDTAPLDPGPAAGLPDIATVTSAGTPVPVLTDYSPNGSPDALVLRFYSLRWEGPSLYTLPDAGAFAANSPYTVELNPTKVLAKDGTTPFSATGALLDGRFSFLTPPFSASFVPPISWFNPDIVFLTFSNLVDLETIVDVVTPHLTATVNGAPVDVAIAPMNEGTLMIIPAAPWPPGATVVISVDAAFDATSLLGEALTAPVAPLTLMIPPMMP